MNDVKLNDLYQAYWKFTDSVILDHSPMAVAGVMMAQAMTLYRTILSEDEFNSLMESILVSHRQDVKPLDIPTLQ